MLPDNILNDLLESVKDGLTRERFAGINEQLFHASTPDLPFGDDEIRTVALYFRQHGTPAKALRLQFHNALDHLVIAARSDTDLFEGEAKIRDGLMEGAIVSIVDYN